MIHFFGGEPELIQALRERGHLMAPTPEGARLVVADLRVVEPGFVKTFRRLHADLPLVTLGSAEEALDALEDGATDHLVRPLLLPVAVARLEAKLTAAPFEVEPGARLGPYVLEYCLGSGGMGDVYRALDTRLGRAVAVKLLPGDLAHHAEVVARFQKEARALARLNHPDVVSIFDMGTEPVPFLVMELMEGQDLGRRLEQGVLPPAEAARVARDVARTLEAVHRHGVLHRDLKPHNLMVQQDGRVRLMDFGLARLLDDEVRLTQAGTALGTPAYMAPEQIEASAGEVDARTDVYALGLVLYEMLVGRLPFRDASLLSMIREIVSGSPVSPRQARDDVPPELDRICRRATERAPSRRYPSAGAMADDLDRFLASKAE